MNKFVSSVLLRRIFGVFVVGLVSRGIINYIYDINVLEEYINIVFIVYSVLIAYFLYDLPIMSLNVFDLKLIRSVIRVYCENYYFSGKFDVKMFSNNINYYKFESEDISQTGPSLVSNQDNSDSRVDSGKELILEKD
jgi:hypothetical protein